MLNIEGIIFFVKAVVLTVKMQLQVSILKNLIVNITKHHNGIFFLNCSAMYHHSRFVES